MKSTTSYLQSEVVHCTMMPSYVYVVSIDKLWYWPKNPFELGHIKINISNVSDF